MKQHRRKNKCNYVFAKSFHDEISYIMRERGEHPLRYLLRFFNSCVAFFFGLLLFVVVAKIEHFMPKLLLWYQRTGFCVLPTFSETTLLSKYVKETFYLFYTEAKENLCIYVYLLITE